MADTDLSTDGEEEAEEELGLVFRTRAGKTAQLVDEINKLEKEFCRRFEIAESSSVNYDWQIGRLVYFDEMTLDFDPKAQSEDCVAPTCSASTEPRAALEETDLEERAAAVLE